MLIRCDWGLCNRLEVLFSFLGEARRKGEAITWIWNNNFCCPGEFADYFEPIANVTCVWSEQTDCHFNGWTPIPPENEQLLCDNLKLKPDVMAAVEQWQSAMEHHYIALHLRRTDLVPHIRDLGYDISGYDGVYSYVEQFPPDTRIFLATDNAESQQVLRERYGKRLFFNPIVPSGNYRQTTLLDAVVDLHVCTAARSFLGTEFSTFSKIISILRKYRNSGPHQATHYPARICVLANGTSVDQVCPSRPLIAQVVNRTDIYEHLPKILASTGPSIVVLEIGAGVGDDTARLVQALRGTGKPYRYFAFECERNNIVPIVERVGPSVHVVLSAIGDRNGTAAFIGSGSWRFSGSVKAPKEHLKSHPWIRFQEPIQVPMTRLDDFCTQAGIDRVDFIWADVQGSEDLLIAGGMETLARTHWLYTEYYDTEEYEGQLPLDEIHRRLPGQWRREEVWVDNVLFNNTSLGIS